MSKKPPPRLNSQPNSRPSLSQRSGPDSGPASGGNVSKDEPDDQLWQRAMKGVKPLGRPKTTQKPAFYAKNMRETPREVGLDTFSAQKRSPDLQAEPLDRSWQKRLRRGRMDVDMTLDLHGMTQDNAYSALMRAMERAVQQQLRIVLVITGKGAPKTQADHADSRPRGVLRQHVPIWLNDSRFAGHVFAVRPAHPTHGGGGAFYILLRRPRG